MPQKADILLVTVTTVESKAVMQAFQGVTKHAPHPRRIGKLVYQDLGEVNGAKVFMTRSEMGAGGLGGAQKTIQKGIKALKPQAVIMVGIAFGVNEQKQAIGDILVSQQLWLYELQRVGPSEIVPRGEKPHASPQLINWVQNAELHWEGAAVRLGLILTGEKLVDNIDYREQLKKLEPEAIGGEMEGAGMYVECQDTGVEWILVKAICDWADGNKSQDKEQRQQLAANNAANFILHTIQQSFSAQPVTQPETIFPPSTLTVASTEITISANVEFPIFEVPYSRNYNFTGLESTITDLRRTFNATDKAIIPQAITGMGGIGKTQIAVEYAYRYQNEYDLVWWIHSEESSTLSADYLALANRLQLPVKTSAEQRVFVNMARHWLEGTSRRWLLIYDNVENIREVSDLLPTQGNGQILITSQHPEWRSHAKILPTDQFTPTEAKAFLLKRTGNNDQTSADKLIELLGGLPLALEQAGAFIEKTGVSLDTYIQLYEKQRRDLWQQETPPKDYKATVTTAWELAFQRIRESSPASITLLNLCAFLAPDEIPLSIFQVGQTYLPKELAKIVSDPLKFENAIAALYHYSLVARKGDTLSIHRLVQEVARERLGVDKIREWIGTVAILMNRVFAYDKYNLATWAASGRLLPHAMTIANYAEKYSTALEQTAILWQRTAEYLRQFGEYARAQGAVEHALKIRQQLFGEDHESTAESLDYLGELYQEQGDYIKALSYHEHALTIRQARLVHRGENSSLVLA